MIVVYMFKALAIQLKMTRVCCGSHEVNMPTTDIVALTHLSKSPAKSQISIWSLPSESKGVEALLFNLNYTVLYAYALKNHVIAHDLSRVLIKTTCQQFARVIFT